MRPFPTPAKVWPLDPATGEQTRRWHVYVCPDLERDTELADLVATVQEVTEKASPGCVVPVERAWLHATVHAIQRSAADLTERDINEFALSLARELADLPPFQLIVRAPLATGAGVLLDLDGDRPGEPWHLLREVVGEVIIAHYGREALTQEVQAPHISLGYCAVTTDSGPVQSALRGARTLPVPFTVTTVHILEVRQHASEHRYTWDTDTVIPIPLGG